ncbi:peptidoglycan DD-metalloendopeptidase family protein [Polaribacter pectinis]|uniref:Peptidoglycan DD-metalloendopeptidase family protein n=1 Tax=Polaribacter pectinis TaxID=2738844 RepID=A0A7G9LAI3_9FLAO|nr:peptidoglycan DD-metalloendopeptidase family protein [Polaribacter pectinis]QNM85632.1 peptidoglycan DD-metalloendopeptidase family protein [Polaribacter pectinis]
MDEKKRYKNFKNWSKNKHFSIKELFPTVEKSAVFHIDLSINNSTVKTFDEFNNPVYFESKLDEIQQKNPTKIIAGGYLEKRALYTSDIYNSLDKNSVEKRNIHLGLDFWLPENTPVHAILEGEVVCTLHQKELKGYGGFIILKHLIDDVEFYTLYGHLSAESVLKFSIGEHIKKGEQIGVLGNYAENGEWVPHLHFQIMLSLLDYKNDFPGVVLESETEFWKNICPNPNLLFKLKGFKEN